MRNRLESDRVICFRLKDPNNHNTRMGQDGEDYIKRNGLRRSVWRKYCEPQGYYNNGD